MKLGFIQPSRPRVNAHRGLSGVCPENTLPAFAAAVAVGADEIEFDLWASRDGELVVCHDAELDRTTNGHGRIGAWDWPDIRRLDSGRWFAAEWAGVAPCRLQDVLELCGGRTVLNIHIKEPGADGMVVRKTRDLLLECGLTGSAYLASELDVLQCAVKHAPELARCCLESPSNGTRMLDCALEYRCARVQFWNPNLTPADIERAHANGIACNLFFGDRPDTPGEAERLVRMGIDTVLTNHANCVIPGIRKLAAGR